MNIIIIWFEIQHETTHTRKNEAFSQQKWEKIPHLTLIEYLSFYIKKCAKLLNWFHANLKRAWKNFHVSNLWMIADDVYIPNEKISKDIGHFRRSLLWGPQCREKIFFAVLTSRLTRYLLITEYIETSVEKGGVPGIAGCLVHGNIIWEAIPKAKDLDVIWLDLTCAYGSVLHQMILLSLRMYHTPEEISKNARNILWWSPHAVHPKRIYNKLEQGWSWNCDGMFGVTKTVRSSNAEIAELSGGLQLPPVKAFIDNITILSSKNLQLARW